MEFWGVAELGEGGLFLEPRGECSGVLAFLSCTVKSFEGAFAVAIQGAGSRYFAQRRDGVRVSIGRQLKVSARMRNVLGLKTLLPSLHSLDENASHATPEDSELLRILLMIHAAAEVSDLPLDLAAHVGAVGGILTQSDKS